MVQAMSGTGVIFSIRETHRARKPYGNARKEGSMHVGVELSSALRVLERSVAIF
jgi:hypothetical protein